MIGDSSNWEYRLERRTAASGLRVVAVEQRHLHRGTIAVYVGAGSRFESAGDNGLSHFLEHMLFRGCARYPSAFALNLAMERLGGTLEASTAPDATGFYVSLPKETLLAGVEIVAEVILRPRFEALETERRIVAEELRGDLDERGRVVDVDALARARIWPGHGLGRPVTGPAGNVARFGRADLERWRGQRYCAGNAVVCVTGGVAAEPAIEAVERAFAAMRPGTPPPAEPAPAGPTGPSVVHVDKPGSQTAIRISLRTPGLCDPDLSAIELLLRLLDDGMSTPLHRRVFEDRGLAYDLGADLEMYADAGALYVDAQCSHENVVPLAQEVLAILGALRDRDASGADLEKAKRRAVWDLQSHLDDADAMSEWYGEQELIARPRRLEDEARAVLALTAADVRRAAERIVRREDLHVTTVGSLGDRQRGALARLVEAGT